MSDTNNIKLEFNFQFTTTPYDLCLLIQITKNGKYNLGTTNIVYTPPSDENN